MRILIVDDDEALINIFTNVFNKNGLDTITAITGKSGIDKAKSEKIDLIILDQILPDMPGGEVLKALKADPATKNIPVIALSNFSQQELVKEALNNGAKDYVFKYQVDPLDLVNKIKTVLKQPND
jgi:DNA-binding response OmpR family regulator